MNRSGLLFGASRRAASWVVLATLLVTVASSYYAISELRIDTDREKMVSSELEFRRHYAHYQEEFPQFIDNLVLVVDADTPERARGEALRVAQRLAALPEVFGIIYLPRADEFLVRNSLLFLGVEALTDLSDRLAEVQPFLGKLAHDLSLRGLFSMLASVLTEKEKGTHVDLDRFLDRVGEALDAALAGRHYELSWQEIMSAADLEPDDRRQYVFAQPRRDFHRLFPAGQALAQVQRIRAELGLDGTDGARLRVTGGLAMGHEELHSVARGAEWIGILVLVMVASVLLLGLRSVRLVVCTLITLVAGLALTAAFATVAIGRLNLISVAFAALYLGLGVDYAIHLCLRYRELILSGAPQGAALAKAATDVGSALKLCALTTAIGFFAFVPTAYAGVAELGIIAGTGMFISLAVTMTVLPALLTLMPLRPRGRRPAAAPRAVDAWLELPAVRRRPVTAVSVVLGLVALFALTGTRFDPNPLHLRDAGTESVQTFRDLLATSKTPPWSITVVASDAAEARTLAERLAGEPEIDKVVRLESFVPKNQEAKLSILAETALLLGPDLDAAAKRKPASVTEEVAATRALAGRLAQYATSRSGSSDAPAARLKQRVDKVLAAVDENSETATRDLVRRLQNAVLKTLPENLARLHTALAAERITASDLPETLRERWVGQGGTFRIEVFPSAVLGDDINALRRFVAVTKRVAPTATGSPVLMIESGNAIVGAFRQAVLFAIVAACVVLLVTLRSVLDVLLVVAPLALAGVLTGATLSLIDLPFNFANVIALPLLLGIGVDSGIHMVHRARLADARNSLRTSTARGVVFSTLTTACSFGSLALSPHRGTASMGLLLTIGIAFVLVCTLVVLPALLAMRHARSRA